jgi:hypothetical protein
MVAVSAVDSGLDPAHVLTLRVSGTYGSETTTATVQRLNRVLDALKGLPGIEATAIASALPGVRFENEVEFTIAEGRADTAPRLIADSRVVAPG